MDDIPAVIVYHSGKIVPSPALDLEVGKVGLPHLIGKPGLMMKLVGGIDKVVFRPLQQSSLAQNTLKARFRDKYFALLQKQNREFSWCELGML